MFAFCRCRLISLYSVRALGRFASTSSFSAAVAPLIISRVFSTVVLALSFISALALAVRTAFGLGGC